jgi:hypothetical protein
VDIWLAALDELLDKPFAAGVDPDPSPAPHHLDLRVSQDFFDIYDPDETFTRIYADFEADRNRLAQAITERYGPPQRRVDLRPIYASETPTEPGAALFDHVCTWSTEVDLWQVGTRGVVVELGQMDNKEPLELILVVGDMSGGDPTAS